MMRDLSLRLPYLIYLCVGSVLLGVLLAPNFYAVVPDPPSDVMREHTMMHGAREVSAEDAPEIEIIVEKDDMDGWNLTLHTENFTFAPRSVNGDHVANTGHAHLYINDIKRARLYGPHFHIPQLPAGTHEISVNLSGNDHSYFLLRGARIEARVKITESAATTTGS